jgi:hypothetical protein
VGYLHIDNAYKVQDIFLFREVWALEKIHGSSAHVKYRKTPDAAVGQLTFFSGGAKHETFVKLFDLPALMAAFELLGKDEVTVYGEVYGGSMQGCSNIYGKELQFIAFDVQVGKCWLCVPDMANVAKGLGFEVVHFEKIPATAEAIDAQRDAPSVQAQRNGCGVQSREGVVLRPLIEVTKNNGQRIIAKHRLEKYNERATPQKIVSPEQLLVLSKADEIANEWVTPMRLIHVTDKLPQPLDLSHTPKVIAAMVEDVYREAKGEIVESKEAQRAISKRTVELFKAFVLKPLPKTEDLVK